MTEREKYLDEEITRYRELRVKARPMSPEWVYYDKIINQLSQYREQGDNA